MRSSCGGQLSFGSHARQLWHSGQARRDHDFDGCVTLVDTLPLAPQLRRRDGQMVTLVGTARRDVTSGHVDFGACNAVGVEITRIVG
ncbi:MAG: hypothetical protein QOD42_36 [Sphingomonadales bacterium]|nr:hypothetical protein [Sphingomonadales bacterium]